jgi:SAM-dependent methyltransferase
MNLGSTGFWLIERKTVTTRVASNFFDEWAIYAHVLEQNYMYHDEIYRDVQQVFADRYRNRPFALLDLGCGSAGHLVRALQGRSVARYIGYDLSAVALAHAERNLSVLGCQVELRRGDLLEGLRRGAEKYDVIFTSFALHHLTAVEKSTFFQFAYPRLNQDGMLVLIDTMRDEAEDRDLYLDRYCDWIRMRFRTLSINALDLLCTHIRNSDFPETTVTLEAMATRGGFGPPIELDRFYWHHTWLFAGGKGEALKID